MQDDWNKHLHWLYLLHSLNGMQHDLLSLCCWDLCRVVISWLRALNWLFLITYCLGFIITLRESALTVKKFEQPCGWETVRLLRDAATQVSIFRCEMYDKNMQHLNRFICLVTKSKFLPKVSTSLRWNGGPLQVYPQWKCAIPLIKYSWVEKYKSWK